MDKIVIKNLEIFANHGMFSEENVLGQKFVVSANLYTDTRQAGLSQDLEKSIHYGIVANQITEFMKNNTFKLIETVAEQLAQELLLSVDRLWAIDLEIKKPWAPVGLPLDYVSVQISRKWHTAFIAVGSNLGDREKYLLDGIAYLKNDRRVRVTKQSDFIVTEPYGGVKQDDFLNGCIEVKTTLTAYELLALMQAAEQNAKRERTIHWGPRTLDLDLIFYDNCTIESEELTVPHIDMQNREFVLISMAQIAPYYRHPILKKTISELLGDLNSMQK